MKTLLIFFAAILCLAVASAHEPGSVTPTPSVQPEATISVEPVSVITIQQCGQAVALIVIDSMGELHPLDLAGKSLSDVAVILAKVPTEPSRRLNVTVTCPVPPGSLST